VLVVRFAFIVVERGTVRSWRRRRTMRARWGRGSTVRNSPVTAEELMTPSPRAEWRRVLAFVTLTVLVVAIAILTKERMVVALLLEASEEIPEGSSVVHIIERSHVDC
jgi:hypothetical protein